MDALAQLTSALADRYTIDREIGRGGMATVYLARDVRHNRRVALKLLSPELGAVLGVERFLSEIQVTANLQHPNLLPLFDSGEAGGLLYYVMPYVEGESLRAKLAREKQLPIDEAIRLATAILAALGYAHRHGVIHRDLKPENILLHEGQPLVADFGIALAVSNAGGQRITQTGLSLGTPHYMSPEQATGDRVIDGRSDIYSLGCVLYEMLTGDPPHTGSTAQAIIARVITDQPRSIRSTRANVPEHIEAAVMRALEKLPADRWESAHAFAAALDERSTGSAIPRGVRTAGAAEPQVAGMRARLLDRRVIAVGALALGALAVATWRLVAPQDDAGSVSFVVEPPVVNGVRQPIWDFALAPDGKTIALVGSAGSNSLVYLRRFTDASLYPVPGTEGAGSAVFSPDGKWLAVVTGAGKLLKVRIDGTSAPMTLAEGVDWYSGVDWPNGETIVLGSARPKLRGLGRIAAMGSAVRELTTAKSDMWAHAFPFADGKALIFIDWGPGFQEDDFLAIGSLETGKHETSSLIAQRPIGVIDHRVIYTAGPAIMAVPFDARTLRLSGDPVRIVEGLSVDEYKAAALSRSGTLAYKRGQRTTRLTLVDGEGRTQSLSNDEHSIQSWGRFSPDGRRIAVDITSPSGDTLSADIWTFDIESRSFRRLTSLGNVVQPEWTSDGRRLVFTNWFYRKPTIWWQVADGSEPPEKLIDGNEGEDLFSARPTPDSRGLVFCRGARYAATVAKAELFYMDFAGERKPERLVNETFGAGCGARVSPDGRWLAYGAIEDGKANVFVRRFRGFGPRVQVSEGNAAEPSWSRDGSRVYYGQGDSAGGGTVIAALLKTTGNSVEVVKRERVAAAAEVSSFEVAPDGKHVLVLQQSDSRVQLVVVTNWLPQLRARLAGVK